MLQVVGVTGVPMSLYEGAPEGGDSLTNPDGVAAAPAPAAAPTTNADGEMIVPEYAPPVAAAAPGQSFEEEEEAEVPELEGTYMEGVPDWVCQMWIVYIVHTLISYFVIGARLLRLAFSGWLTRSRSTNLAGVAGPFVSSLTSGPPLPMCPEGKEQLAEGWENPDTGLKCVVDPVFHSTLNCDCTSSESSFDFMQLVTAIGPFIHCILMPYFMKQKQEYGKKQLEASLDANRESAMMQDDGKMVVFAIKYTLGQKIFIFICGTIIKLVGFAISIAKMAGMDFSSFWFPLPFFNFVSLTSLTAPMIPGSRIAGVAVGGRAPGQELPD